MRTAQQRPNASLQKQMTAWRRDFHRHPEIGFAVKRTASVVEKFCGSAARKPSASPMSASSEFCNAEAAKEPSDFARNWTPCPSPKPAAFAIVRQSREKCTPADTTGIPQCCWGRRADWRKSANLTARRSSFFSPTKKTASARKR